MTDQTSPIQINAPTDAEIKKVSNFAAGFFKLAHEQNITAPEMITALMLINGDVAAKVINPGRVPQYLQRPIKAVAEATGATVEVVSDKPAGTKVH